MAKFTGADSYAQFVTNEDTPRTIDLKASGQTLDIEEDAPELDATTGEDAEVDAQFYLDGVTGRKATYKFLDKDVDTIESIEAAMQIKLTGTLYLRKAGTGATLPERTYVNCKVLTRKFTLNFDGKNPSSGELTMRLGALDTTPQS